MPPLMTLPLTHGPTPAPRAVQVRQVWSKQQLAQRGGVSRGFRVRRLCNRCSRCTCGIAGTLGGAALMLAADIGVRMIPTGLELKVGVITAIIGAPFFLHLLFVLRRSRP